MYIFKIHGKEYKVRYTYRTICEGDIIDRISDATNFEGLDVRGMIERISKATAELLLVGLQKYHSKELICLMTTRTNPRKSMSNLPLHFFLIFKGSCRRTVFYQR